MNAPNHARLCVAAKYLGDFLAVRSKPRHANARAHEAMVQALNALHAGDEDQAHQFLSEAERPTLRSSAANLDRFDLQERKRITDVVRNTRDILVNVPLAPEPAKPYVRDRALKASDVFDLVGLGRTTWYSLIRQGKAPPPVKVSANRVIWLESTIYAWIAAKTRG